jgi:phosphoserine phosphatase
VIPLFVDLDGTLIKCSTTGEETRRYIKKNGLFKTLAEVSREGLFSKLKFKTWISDQAIEIDYSCKFNEQVVTFLRKRKSFGDELILATGSPSKSAARVLEQSPIKFDDVLTSSINLNLKGKNKLSQIQEYLRLSGDKEFTYIGDALIDLKIMREAQNSYFVGKKLVYLIGKFVFKVREIKYLSEITSKDHN